MTIPTPEAIEAAARAMYEDFRLDHKGRFANTPIWDKLGTSEQDHWRRHARVAYPIIAAQAKAEALREAAQALDRVEYARPDTPERDHYNTMLAIRRGGTTAWLRGRAAIIERGGE
ncbi:hypothetical protein [Arthrobacter sp. GMC3]|uniref:hypothetical protein n=1 Tax=Arthrobacter sp. GMC3 TaxID=2058894 RepID=UPI000CE3700C|nr:hypothetical protein [Arthrobacter sp. GMC3]